MHDVQNLDLGIFVVFPSTGARFLSLKYSSSKYVNWKRFFGPRNTSPTTCEQRLLKRISWIPQRSMSPFPKRAPMNYVNRRWSLRCVVCKPLLDKNETGAQLLGNDFWPRNTCPTTNDQRFSKRNSRNLRRSMSPLQK